MAKPIVDRNGRVWPNWTPIRFRDGQQTKFVAYVVPGPRPYVTVRDPSDSRMIVALDGRAMRALAEAFIEEDDRTAPYTRAPTRRTKKVGQGRGGAK